MRHTVRYAHSRQKRPPKVQDLLFLPKRRAKLTTHNHPERTPTPVQES